MDLRSDNYKQAEIVFDKHPAIQTLVVCSLVAGVVGIGALLRSVLLLNQDALVNNMKAGFGLLVVAGGGLGVAFSSSARLELFSDHLAYSKKLWKFHSSTIINYSEIGKLNVTIMERNLIIDLVNGKYFRISPSIVLIKGRLPTACDDPECPVDGPGRKMYLVREAILQRMKKRELK